MLNLESHSGCILEALFGLSGSGQMSETSHGQCFYAACQAKERVWRISFS